MLPKSGCSAVAPEPLISAMYAAERVETGCVEMSVFHALSAGNTAATADASGVEPRRSRRVAPQVAASVRSAAPMAKWDESCVHAPVYRQTCRVWSGAGRSLVSFRPVTTIFGFIPSPSKGILHLGPLPLHAYGLCLAIGVLVAAWIAERRWEAKGGEPGTIGEIGVIVVVSGVIGARVYHLFTGYDWHDGGLAGTVKIWQGGLSIWGAVAGGALAVVRRRAPAPAHAAS